jgi:DNA replication protein DnaC
LHHHAAADAPRGRVGRPAGDEGIGSERQKAVLGQYLAGSTGTGKSWLACALGHKACRDNRTVLYQRIPRMFGDLALARGDGRYPRLMRALGGVKLLILDDWGLEPLGPEQRRDMLEIVEDRYGRGATLITSQIPVDRWHVLIGEPTLADAILDRIIHNAHRLQLSGDSLRKQNGPKTTDA